ncbi:glycosyltransferase [Brevibacillus panacihumi]|uniref:glycosyltransferase n=1 Tax=Brevibacillus panacihumi TaxID=497735 RepID=UPI003D246112
MKTSIVILTHNHLEITQFCIDSIRKYTNPQYYELIIVDNASTDGTVQWLKQQQDIRSIYNQENMGFPAGCNQGMRIATGNNIMLLNNDVVVTEGWLENLLKCLYSRDDIGAVGPVTNRCSYYQTIPVNYQNLEEMQSFASTYNQSNPTMWEERLKLIGYAFLFKKEVYRSVGELDEIFSPGNFEDDDFSLRIRQAGYKLILCKDTFIHHFGSVSFREKPIEYQNLLVRNKEKFVRKWKFDSQTSMMIRYEVLPHIHHRQEDSFSLLEIGCGCGGTLLQVKNNFPNANIYGYDSNSYAIKEAAPFAQVGTGNWEDIHSKYTAEQFDYIVINNIVEKVTNPITFMQKVKMLLRPSGSLILISKNLNHISVIQTLIKGNSPFASDEKRYYTLNELTEILKSTGFFHFEFSTLPTWLDRPAQDLLKKITSPDSSENVNNLDSYEFVIRATRDQDSFSILGSIDDIKRGESVEGHLQALRRRGADLVISQVMAEPQEKVATLNLLAVKNFEIGFYEDVLPYLQTAYELDENNPDTLHNIVAFLEFSGERDLASWFTERLGAVSANHKETITASNRWVGQRLKFTLRRIEYGVNMDDSMKVIFTGLQEGELSISEIIDVIQNDIIHKVEMLNLLASQCFEIGLHENVIPFLQKAYEIDPKDQNTLYNLGYVFQAYGEKRLASSFLEQIEYPDDMALELMAALKGTKSN